MELSLNGTRVLKSEGRFLLPTRTLTENQQTLEVRPTNKKEWNKIENKQLSRNHRIYKLRDWKVAHGAVTGKNGDRDKLS